MYTKLKDLFWALMKHNSHRKPMCSYFKIDQAIAVSFHLNSMLKQHFEYLKENFAICKKYFRKSKRLFCFFCMFFFFKLKKLPYLTD